MITVDEYCRRMLDLLPKLAKDAFDPERIQTAIAANIDNYYGETNRKPKYPSPLDKLNLVTGTLFKAATVYRAKGNVSRYKQDGATFTYSWGIDLDVVAYARIHEYGGQAGRGLKATIPARPYITPAIKDFDTDTVPQIIEIMLRKLREQTK